MLPQITPSCVRIAYLQSFLFWVYSRKNYLIWCFKHRLNILSLIAIFLSNCKRFRNLAISVLRGIFIMTVVLPQRSPSSFYRSLFSKCKAYNGKYLSIIFLSFFQLSFYLSQFMSQSIHVTILPLEMWHKLFCHNFETFITLVNEDTLITSSTWLHHGRWNYFLIRMGVCILFPYFTSRTQQSLFHQYFCKSCLHVILLMRFVFNFFCS
jgi:hypothetical protein